MRLRVKVVPKSSKSLVAGSVGDVLKVCVTAPPERGKANAEVESVLSQVLGIPTGWVHVIAGKTSSRKVIEVTGLDEAEVHRRLGRIS